MVGDNKKDKKPEGEKVEDKGKRPGGETTEGAVITVTDDRT